MSASNKLPHGFVPDAGKQMTKNGVTVREEQFCQAYLIDFNIAKASRIAGMTDNSGYALMRRARVQKRIHQIRIDTGKALDITREKLLQELMKIAYADVRDTAEDDLLGWSDDAAAAVAGVEYDLLGQIKKVTRYDKLKAIELLNKMLGFNMPEQSINKNLNINSEPMNKEDIRTISNELEKLF